MVRSASCCLNSFDARLPCTNVDSQSIVITQKPYTAATVPTCTWRVRPEDMAVGAAGIIADDASWGERDEAAAFAAIALREQLTSQLHDMVLQSRPDCLSGSGQPAAEQHCFVPVQYTSSNQDDHDTKVTYTNSRGSSPDIEVSRALASLPPPFQGDELCHGSCVAVTNKQHHSQLGPGNGIVSTEDYGRQLPDHVAASLSHTSITSCTEECQICFDSVLQVRTATSCHSSSCQIATCSCSRHLDCSCGRAFLTIQYG